MHSRDVVFMPVCTGTPWMVLRTCIILARLVMKAHVYALLGSLALPATVAVAGDTIRIPVGQQEGTISSTTLPPRGMKRDQVRARHGRPGGRTTAVGDPPISRWHYDGFTVYFEEDTVVHSVVTH